MNMDGERRWIIVLEGARSGEASPIEADAVRSILQAMGEGDGAALHSSERLAVRVQVSADDVALALAEALARWRAAAARSLPGWDVLRAEVLTPEEFESDCQSE